MKSRLNCKISRALSAMAIVSSAALASASQVSPAPSSAPRGISVGDPSPSSSPGAQPKLFPPRSPAIPVASPSVSAMISDAEASALLKQFKKSQDVEMAALKHRQKTEMKELKAAHKAQLGEWDSKERDARHKYFAEHTKGPERRSWVQDSNHRRDLLTKMQSDDEDRRSKEQSVRMDALKSEQAQRLKEFQDYLSRKERPPARLWTN